MYKTKALAHHFFLSAVQYFYSIVVVLAAKLTHKFCGSLATVFHILRHELGTTKIQFTDAARIQCHVMGCFTNRPTLFAYQDCFPSFFFLIFFFIHRPVRAFETHVAATTV